jgi:hypothetical protein
MNDFLVDLFSRRLNDEIGGLGVRTVELYGGMVIEPTAFEPDPTTYRDEYYYNAISNALFKKIIVRKEFSILSAYWQRVSA